MLLFTFEDVTDTTPSLTTPYIKALIKVASLLFDWILLVSLYVLQTLPLGWEYVDFGILWKRHPVIIMLHVAGLLHGLAFGYVWPDLAARILTLFLPEDMSERMNSWMYQEGLLRR